MLVCPGWMHETSARTWCTGKTQRERVEREVGGGIGMGNTCKTMAVSFQCMKKFTTNKKKFFFSKKKKEMLVLHDTLDQLNDTFKSSRFDILVKYTWNILQDGSKLCHKTTLNTFQKTEIISSIVSDHKSKRIKSNYKKKTNLQSIPTCES